MLLLKSTHSRYGDFNRCTGKYTHTYDIFASKNVFMFIHVVVVVVVMSVGIFST